MDQTNIERLKKEFGLSYHIEYAALAEQHVGFAGKRILEVGGSLPESLVLREFSAAQWTALEEMDYWTETLSTGHVLGTPPTLEKNKIKLVDAKASDLRNYNLFHGRIEELPNQLDAQFDMVFSIAAFEHISKLPTALEKMKNALIQGGKLFSMFAPIWSSYNGHHLPEIVDSTGNHWNFGNSPIPPWGHLLLRPMELFDLLCQKCDHETAREIVYFTYKSPHINRFFLDDYLEIIKRSGFKILNANPIFETRIPDQVNKRLCDIYPGCNDFNHSGLLLILEKP